MEDQKSKKVKLGIKDIGSKQFGLFFDTNLWDSI